MVLPPVGKPEAGPRGAGIAAGNPPPGGGIEIQFDPALVEEAVFLELRRREASGDRSMATAFHAQRSSLYGAAGEREARFQQLAAHYFHELGLAGLVTKRFEEFPLVAAHVQTARVQRVWSRKEERVELYVHPDAATAIRAERDGRPPAVFGIPPRSTGLHRRGGRPAPYGRASIAASTTLLLGLQAARWLNPDTLVAFLRHELMHISDMLDSAFAYEPYPAFGSECETENDLVRERFRLLWDIWVAGRMRRNEWPLPDAGRNRRGLDQAFASWEPERREAVFQDIDSRDRCTQRELLDLAKDERLTRMLGAGGVRCPLCHFPTRDGIRAWDGEWAPIAQAIHADYPDWTPTQGACVQCADLYRARVYAVR